MKFTKMQGCGNDYVYVNCFEEDVENPSELAKTVSNRNFGIGSDGLILIEPSFKADFRMRMFNSDGSEGEMCGNGIRCAAKLVYDKGLTDQTLISIETKAGIRYLELKSYGGRTAMLRVDMGSPVTRSELIPVISDHDPVLNEEITVDGTVYHMTCVSMGNPHAVVFIEDTNALEIDKTGPAFEHHKRFPKQVNTEFIQVIDRKNLKMRVWERGSGETMACGTGACAGVVAAVLNGYTDDEVCVHLPGGELDIHYDRTGNKIYMTGPAVTVFEGELII